MPNTGTRSPTNQTGLSYNQSNAYDGNDSTSGLTFGIGSSKTHTLGGFDGDDLPAGSTVTGVKVTIRAQHYVIFSYEAATFESVKLSLNDGSAYSSNILSSNQNTTTSAVDYEFGGESETWGLDWSGFTDISDLKVEYITNAADGSGNHYFVTYEVEAIVYYTEAAEVTTETNKVIMKSGTLHLKSGNIIIK